MSRQCALVGKKVMTGNNVSHANNRTRRRFIPNLQRFSLPSKALGKKIRLRLAVSTLRTIDKKGGLDDFLTSTPNRKLASDAIKLKKQILAKTVVQK